MTNIQVEDVSQFRKKITFEVPEERVSDILESEYRDLKKTVQIKGFRRGKAPLNIVKSYFRTKVEGDAARRIIEETFEPGLEEKQIKPFAVISMEPEIVESGKPFRYTVEVDVPPDCEATNYKGLSLTKTVREVSDGDISERLEQLRELSAKLVPVSEPREVRIGDHLIIDVEATCDGEVIPALTVTDYHMEMGRDFYLPDFDSRIYGMSPDETREFDIEFSQEFPRKNLAGKTASFTITCASVKERVLPDLDDAFAKDIGQFETLQELKARLKTELVKEFELQSERELRDQIIDLLMESNQFEVPDSMVEQEIDEFMARMVEGYVAQGIDRNKLPVPSKTQRDQVRPTALKTLRTGLILKSIIKQEAIEITDEEVQEAIERHAKERVVSPDFFRDRLTDDNMMEIFRANLLEDKVYRFIEDQAEVTEQKGGPEKQESDDL